MHCEEAKRALDAYIDGELDCETARELEAHAKTCETCSGELEAAIQIKHALAHLDDDVVVPLKAQAAWRKAIHKEASKSPRKHVWRRSLYAVTAALVLVFGVQFVLDGMDNRQSGAALLEQDAPVSRTLVARDGGLGNSEDDAEHYTVWKKMDVISVDEAFQSIQMLADEYSGSCVLEGDSACRIEIPCEYLDDFLKAAQSIGVETYSETAEHKTETAFVLFQIYENDIDK